MLVIAVLESGSSESRFAKEQTIYLVSEYLNQHTTFITRGMKNAW